MSLLSRLFGGAKKAATPPTEKRTSGSMVTPELRDILFGEAPLNVWASGRSISTKEPWESFVVANSSLTLEDRTAAIQSLKSIVISPGFDSRHYLEAWSALRSLGVQPEESNAKTLYGVVVEVALSGSVDTVAAYADFSARYFNHAGPFVILDERSPESDSAIQKLLDAATSVVREIGPWTDPLPGPPTGKMARISMLTPSGLHFGQGPFDAISQDPLGGPVLASGFELMKLLMELSRRNPASRPSPAAS